MKCSCEELVHDCKAFLALLTRLQKEPGGEVFTAMREQVRASLAKSAPKVQCDEDSCYQGKTECPGDGCNEGRILASDDGVIEVFVDCGVCDGEGVIDCEVCCGEGEYLDPDFAEAKQENA